MGTADCRILKYCKVAKGSNTASPSRGRPYSNAPRIPPDVLACYVRAFFGERAIELCWLLAVGGCWCLLLVACCLLLVACCLLLVVCCLLPVAWWWWWWW